MSNATAIHPSDPSAIRIARARFERMLTDAQHRTAATLDKIERDVPTDRVARASALSFVPANDNSLLVHLGQSTDAPMHSVAPHAFGQALSRAGIPRGYADELLSPDRRDWGAPLLAHAMNEHYRHDNGRVLVRSVDDRVRAVLSDRYRRMDTRPIVFAFLDAARNVGAMPLRSHATETRVAISVVLDEIFQPLPSDEGHEILVLGATLTSSDWGCGPVACHVFAERLVCLNGLICEQTLRAVHLGARLADSIEFSQRTHELDTATMASGVRDIVTGLLSRESLDSFQQRIRAAHHARLSPQRIGDFLGKTLTKSEKQEVVGLFNSPDVVMLPRGQNAYRLAQALGLRANQVDDDDTRIRLQRLGGDALSLAEAA
jgi:hypothetical protein